MARHANMAKVKWPQIGSLILVAWHDSHVQDGWHERYDINAAIEKAETAIHSVGFMAAETAKVISITATWQTYDDSYAMAVTIPKSCIESLHTLVSAGTFHDWRLGMGALPEGE